MIRKDESKDKTKTRFSKWVLPCLGKIIKIQMICKKKTGNWRKGLRCTDSPPLNGRKWLRCRDVPIRCVRRLFNVQMFSNTYRALFNDGYYLLHPFFVDISAGGLTQRTHLSVRPYILHRENILHRGYGPAVILLHPHVWACIPLNGRKWLRCRDVPIRCVRRLFNVQMFPDTYRSLFNDGG